MDDIRTCGRVKRSLRATIIAALGIGVMCAPTAALAKKKGVWTVVRTADPITGRRTCAVSALDRFAGSRFSQVGGLYAVVENNPDAGLLVGVSSGGRYRMPVGDIVWRVDNQPYRTLKAVNNPHVAQQGNTEPSKAAAAQTPDTVDSTMAEGKSLASSKSAPENSDRVEPSEQNVSAATPSNPVIEAYTKTLTATMQQQSAMVAALTATATMASGDTAQAMLDEMREGKTLLFRQQAATPLYGLPSSNVYAVGQETLKGRKPIPIDQSFHDGLVACGIAAP